MCECVILIMCSNSVKVNIFYWIEIFFKSYIYDIGYIVVKRMMFL